MISFIFKPVHDLVYICWDEEVVWSKIAYISRRLKNSPNSNWNHPWILNEEIIILLTFKDYERQPTWLPRPSSYPVNPNQSRCTLLHICQGCRRFETSVFFSVKINISTTEASESASFNLIPITHNIKGFHVQICHRGPLGAKFNDMSHFGPFLRVSIEGWPQFTRPPWKI